MPGLFRQFGGPAVALVHQRHVHGIVKQRIDAAEPGNRVGRHALHGLAVPHIDLLEGGPIGAGLLDDGPAIPLVDIGHDDLGAGGGKSADAGAPDTRGRAGDYSNLARKIGHRRHPSPTLPRVAGEGGAADGSYAALKR